MFGFEANMLRAKFVQLLTEDSPHKDRRRKDYNQAIFFPAGDESFPGAQVFNGTDLGMVLEKFDRALKLANVLQPS